MKTQISALGFCLFLLSVPMMGQLDDVETHASQLYNQGAFEECIATLNTSTNPKSGDLIFMEANCHQKLNNLEEALRSYDLAELRKCADDELYLNRGICRLSAGLNDAAEMDFNRHLADNPQDIKALYYLGQLEYMRFDTGASLSYLAKATAIDPNVTEAIFLEGGNYADMERWESAEVAFRQVLELDKNHLEARKALAVTLIQQHKMQAAIEALDQITNADDAMMAEVYFYQAEAYYSIHNDEKACELWMLSDYLGDPDAGKNLINICEKGKDKLRTKKKTFAKF